LFTLDVSTKLNSIYTMLNVAEKFQRAFEIILDEDINFINYLCDNGTGRKGLGFLIEDDWHNVQLFIKFMQVFYVMTEEIDGTNLFHKIVL
jgi:hypothetical protein